MRKIAIIYVGLAVVCSFWVTTASSALAAEWLWNGGPITTALAVDHEGTFILKVLATSGGAVLFEIECSMLFEGTVVGGTGTMTDAVDLEGKVVGELEMTNVHPMNCTTTSSAGGLGDCTLNGLDEVTTDGLNLELGLTWATTLELMTGVEEEEEFLLDLPEKSGYDVLCTTPGGLTVEQLCEGLVSADLLNTAEGDVLANFLGNSFVSCTLTGAGTGAVIGEYLISHAGEAGTLSVSE